MAGEGADAAGLGRMIFSMGLARFAFAIETGGKDHTPFT